MSDGVEHRPAHLNRVRQTKDPASVRAPCMNCCLSTYALGPIAHSSGVCPFHVVPFELISVTYCSIDLLFLLAA